MCVSVSVLSPGAMLFWKEFIGTEILRDEDGAENSGKTFLIIYIFIYILELMYDMVGEPYPARSWNPSQSVILTFTYFECHLPRWAFLKWISPHTQIQIHKYTNTNILSRWLFLQWSSTSQPWGVWGSLKLGLWKLVRYPPPSSHHHHHLLQASFRSSMSHHT